MNQLQTFKNELFEVSAKIENGQILFDAEQVAICLGITTEVGGKTYVRWKRVNSYLPKDLPQVAKGDLIPEPLVYKLAFKASNELAEKFQDWLAIEVIPTIRKTGSYSIKKLDSYMIDDPIERAKRWIEEQEEKLAIQQQLQIAAPKAEMYDVALSADNAQTMSIVAKTLGYGRNRLFAFLREQGVLRQNNEPYQEFIDRGYFRIRQVPISRSSGTQNKPQTLVTAKGMDYIARLLKKHGLLKRAL